MSTDSRLRAACFTAAPPRAFTFSAAPTMSSRQSWGERPSTKGVCGLMQIFLRTALRDGIPLASAGFSWFQIPRSMLMWLSTM